MNSGLVVVKCQATEEGHISVPATPLPYIATAAELLSNTYPEPDQILQNFADKGTKIALISMSKGRKSWFLLQMAIALATGIPKFLGWSIPRARKVLLIQFEIPELHFAKRLSKLTDSLKVNKPDIESNLLIANWRGGSFNLLSSVHSNNLIQFIKDNGIEVLIFDPLYKILPEGENKPEDIKPVLNTFDKLCEETGVALFYSHHAPKGISGDRPGIDASSGSGVIGRDMDGQITLFQHVQADLQVVDIISRLYPCLDPFSVRFCPDSCLFEASQELPHVLTSKNKNFRRSNAVKKSLTKDQMLSLADPPLGITEYREALRKKFSMTVREVDSYLEESKRTGALVTWRYPVVQGITYIGQSEQIQILKDQYNVSKKKQTRHTELPCVESANKCTEPTEQTLHNTLTV